MPLFSARDGDLASVAALINSAYRGETSRLGWTTEADYLEGLRIDDATLRAEIRAKPQAMLLTLRETRDGPLLGCVWLEPDEPGAWYLGLLTVRPDLQDRKLGRGMLAEAEAIVRERGARRMRMTVVHIRDELIAWYARRGYFDTGRTEPFPYASALSTPNRYDLHFKVLEKEL